MMPMAKVMVEIAKELKSSGVLQGRLSKLSTP
jgi:hypothetical protein